MYYSYIMFIYIFSLILSFIIGLFLFQKKDIHGPNSNKIKEKIYKINNKYYQFTTEICICPINDYIQCVKKK